MQPLVVHPTRTTVSTPRPSKFHVQPGVEEGACVLLQHHALRGLRADAIVDLHPFASLDEDRERRDLRDEMPGIAQMGLVGDSGEEDRQRARPELREQLRRHRELGAVVAAEPGARVGEAVDEIDDQEGGPRSVAGAGREPLALVLGAGCGLPAAGRGPSALRPAASSFGGARSLATRLTVPRPRDGGRAGRGARRARPRCRSRIRCMSCLGCRRPGEHGQDGPPVGIEGLVFRIVHEIDGEVVGPPVAQRRELLDVILDAAEHAETVDDVIRNEIGRRVPCPAVVGVVVVGAVLDVVGERLRHVRGVFAVAFDELGHMVADHAAEPAQLLALVRDVVADVGRRHHAGGDRARRTPLRRGGVHDRGAGPLQDAGVCELKHEAVGVAADAVERTGAVAGAPHGQVPALRHPWKRDLRPVVVDRLPRHQTLDHPHGLDHLGQRPGLASDPAQRRVAPSDPADGPRAVGVVQGREGRSEHRPVARARVGDHRTDDDPFGLGQDPGEDDERLLPQHRRVEHPHVSEAVGLGPLREVDHASGRGIGLQYDAEVHRSPSVERTSAVPAWLGPGAPHPSRPPAYQGAMPVSTARVEIHCRNGPCQDPPVHNRTRMSHPITCTEAKAGCPVYPLAECTNSVSSFPSSFPSVPYIIPYPNSAVVAESLKCHRIAEALHSSNCYPCV